MCLLTRTVLFSIAMPSRRSNKLLSNSWTLTPYDAHSQTYVPPSYYLLRGPEVDLIRVLGATLLQSASLSWQPYTANTNLCRTKNGIGPKPTNDCWSCCVPLWRECNGEHIGRVRNLINSMYWEKISNKGTERCEMVPTRTNVYNLLDINGR